MHSRAMLAEYGTVIDLERDFDTVVTCERQCKARNQAAAESYGRQAEFYLSQKVVFVHHESKVSSSSYAS